MAARHGYGKAKLTKRESEEERDGERTHGIKTNINATTPKQKSDPKLFDESKLGPLI